MRVRNRAAETTTSTGTGDLTLAGTITGYQSLSVIGAGNVFTYLTTEYPAAINWEIGIGTYATGPARLQRTTVLASSNGGAAVNWGAGTKLVRCALPAELGLLNRHEAKVAGYTAGAADVGKVFENSGTFTIAYAAVATLGAGWWCVMVNKTGVQTHDPNAAETIDGVATFAPAVGENFVVYCNGTELHTVGRKTAQTLDTTRIDVASAATVSLTASAPNTRHINITGTTTITGFTVAAGLCYFVRFSGSLTLTNNAGIITQTGANIVTQAGDTCILRATAANTVEVLAYVPAILNQQTTRSMVRLHTSNGYGSTNTVIRRFSTTVTNQGADITYADSATLGATFTINAAGVYALSYSDNFNSAADMGLSLNSSQLTTSIFSITAADRLAATSTGGVTFTGLAAWIGYLPSGSVIRPHGTGQATSAAALAQFTISRMF